MALKGSFLRLDLIKCYNEETAFVAKIRDRQPALSNLQRWQIVTGIGTRKLHCSQQKLFDGTEKNRKKKSIVASSKQENRSDTRETTIKPVHCIQLSIGSGSLLPVQSFWASPDRCQWQSTSGSHEIFTPRRWPLNPFTEISQSNVWHSDQSQPH